ncbi:MAG: hypothetical protein JWQ06_517 [Mucilaginibacter sp.]|nr:hypothetical protein [Mucilaginibacter sp.]
MFLFYQVTFENRGDSPLFSINAIAEKQLVAHTPAMTCKGNNTVTGTEYK